MGQYDYQGTPQSRMYDWLVTRQGESLSLCEEITEEQAGYEIQWQDLEYIRDLVRSDQDGGRVSHATGVISDADDASEPTKRDPNVPAPATGGVDYYDMVDPQTGKKKGLPEALGPAPPPTRRYLDENNQWQEGDRPLYIPIETDYPDQEEPTDA